MSHVSEKLKKKLLSILKDEYEDCGFFLAASQMLINKFAPLVFGVIRHQAISFRCIITSKLTVALVIPQNNTRRM